MKTVENKTFDMERALYRSQGIAALMVRWTERVP